MVSSKIWILTRIPGLLHYNRQTSGASQRKNNNNHFQHTPGVAVAVVQGCPRWSPVPCTCARNRCTCKVYNKKLHARLDSGSRCLCANDFRRSLVSWNLSERVISIVAYVSVVIYSHVWDRFAIAAFDGVFHTAEVLLPNYLCEKLKESAIDIWLGTFVIILICSNLSSSEKLLLLSATSD